MRCWGGWSTHTCAVLHFFRKVTAADSPLLSSRPPCAGHWSTAIISPHVTRPQNACTSPPPYSSCHTLPRRTALNIHHKCVQRCSVPSFLSASTVNKCNVCQGCSSHPLEANRRMSNFTKGKRAIRLSLSLLCTSLSSSWPTCRLLSQKGSQDFALNRHSNASKKPQL